MRDKLRAMLQTNDVQVHAVCFFTLINLYAVYVHGWGWWQFVTAALMWPALVLIGNFFSPIPPKDGR